MWHHINEERDDKSFMGVERVSWGWNCFQNSDALETGSWNLHWRWSQASFSGASAYTVARNHLYLFSQDKLEAFEANFFGFTYSGSSIHCSNNLEPQNQVIQNSPLIKKITEFIGCVMLQQTFIPFVHCTT